MKKLLAALLLITSPAAFADLLGSVDAFYVPKAEIDLGGSSDDGDGFGVRGRIDALPLLTLTGEYRTTSYDDFDTDYDQLRLGAGMGVSVAVASFDILAEYIDGTVDSPAGDTDQSGVGIHGRVSTGAIPMLTLYGQLGYLATKFDGTLLDDDFTGTEINLGAVYHVTKLLGVVLDWRQTDLEGDDTNTELKFTDISVGARLSL